MESLEKKCKIIRKLVGSSRNYEDNDVYVILSTEGANSPRSPCSALLITALEKLRQAAGILRSSREPNLILVSNMDKIPLSSHTFVHWDSPIFNLNIGPTLIESAARIFDDQFKNLNPFLRLDDGKLLNLYGPEQDPLDFELAGHEKNHELMRKAIKSVLTANTPKFSDFQLAIQSAIFSQNCEFCLSNLLDPLEKVDDVQKLVFRLTRGVCCPREKSVMQLAIKFSDENGKKFASPSWRLREHAELPKCSKEPRKKAKNQRAHLETVRNVMELLNGNIKKLGEETDFERMERSEQLAAKLKSHTIGLSLLYIELQGSALSVGAFGFETGLAELDEGLERAASSMLKAGKKFTNITDIVAHMDKKTRKLYEKNSVNIERQILNKITKKLREIVEFSFESEDEEESSSGSASSSEQKGEQEDSENEENAPKRKKKIVKRKEKRYVEPSDSDSEPEPEPKKSIVISSDSQSSEEPEVIGTVAPPTIGTISDDSESSEEPGTREKSKEITISESESSEEPEEIRPQEPTEKMTNIGVSDDPESSEEPEPNKSSNIMISDDSQSSEEPETRKKSTNISISDDSQSSEEPESRKSITISSDSQRSEEPEVIGTVAPPPGLLTLTSRMEKELLSKAYSEAETALRGTSQLPVIRQNVGDALCVFCVCFVIDPLPDFSCGYHDLYQQMVNKEFAARFGDLQSIDEQIRTELVAFMALQKKKWAESDGSMKRKGVDGGKKEPAKKKKKKSFATKKGRQIQPGDSDEEDTDSEPEHLDMCSFSTYLKSPKRQDLPIEQRIEKALQYAPEQLLNRPMWSTRAGFLAIAHPEIAELVGELGEQVPAHGAQEKASSVESMPPTPPPEEVKRKRGRPRKRKWSSKESSESSVEVVVNLDEKLKLAEHNEQKEEQKEEEQKETMSTTIPSLREEIDDSSFNFTVMDDEEEEKEPDAQKGAESECIIID